MLSSAIHSSASNHSAIQGDRERSCSDKVRQLLGSHSDRYHVLFWQNHEGQNDERHKSHSRQDDEGQDDESQFRFLIVLTLIVLSKFQTSLLANHNLIVTSQSQRRYL